MKKSIGVVFGGRSAEHEVSIITAHIPIIQSLEATGQFEVWPIYISKTGLWYANQDFNDLKYFQADDWEEKVSREKNITLSLENGLRIIWPGLRQKSVKLDMVFPSMHGTYGEDGSLMGILRMANVPFVGCDMAASAVAMDKVLTKQVLSAENIPIVPYVWFSKQDWQNGKNELKEKIKKLSWPVFVKPVHLGSSIAITKVSAEEGLENAIEVALHYDDKVLVEESVEDLIEVTLPIMGNHDLKTAELERPLNKTEFLDFKDKYLSGSKKGQTNSQGYSEIPAKIDPELDRQAKELGKRVYKTLGCSGIARVDFLIDSSSQTVYVNEVNTLPGSLYHHNWKQAGVSGIELVTKLVALAEEKFAEQKSLTYIFNSDILKKNNGTKIS